MKPAIHLSKINVIFDCFAVTDYIEIDFSRLFFCMYLTRMKKLMPVVAIFVRCNKVTCFKLIFNMLMVAKTRVSFFIVCLCIVCAWPAFLCNFLICLFLNCWNLLNRLLVIKFVRLFISRFTFFLKILVQKWLKKSILIPFKFLLQGEFKTGI